MGIRARRSSPRPPARRGGVVIRAARKTPPLVNGFGIEFVSPVNGFHSRDRRPDLTVIGYSKLLTPVDIQIEWRTQLAYQPGSNPTPQSPWLPSPTHLVTLRDAISGTPQTMEPPADLTYNTWWYRGRVGDVDTNIWSNWSAQYHLDVYPILGSVSEYIDINLGVENVQLLNALAYLEMNIGVSTASEYSLMRYLSLNIGVNDEMKIASEYMNLNVYPPTGQYQAAAYTDINAVSDETPVPHIWWIRPEQGREGYVFNIYGHGFGAFQTEYDGQVKLGNLVCSIARWETVPPELVASTVKVTGTPRATVSTTTLPYVLLNPGPLVFNAGDIIEYDMLWEVPSGSRLDIFPYFTDGSFVMGFGAMVLQDTTGDAWMMDQPEAYGSWHHRRFVIPAGHYLVGRTVTNFGIGWYGSDPVQPVRTGSIRSFVIRDSSETPRLWITADDGNSAPALTYVANTGTLTSTEFDQEGHTIEHGLALAPDLITPEHGWIVAIVPTGAVSSSVQVTLEDS